MDKLLGKTLCPATDNRREHNYVLKHDVVNKKGEILYKRFKCIFCNRVVKDYFDESPSGKALL